MWPLKEYARVRELTARNAAGVAPAIESLTARHLLLRSGDATAAVIDLGTLATQGQRNAFLEFSKPPALKNFMLDEGLVLFINVAEDVAAGKLQITGPPTNCSRRSISRYFLAANSLKTLIRLLNANSLPQSIGLQVLNSLQAMKVLLVMISSLAMNRPIFLPGVFPKISPRPRCESRTLPDAFICRALSAHRLPR